MARRGSFVRMLEEMIKLAGSSEMLVPVMLKSEVGRDYLLVTAEDAVNMRKIDVDGDLQVVMALSYNELKQVLKPRQFDLLRGEKNGDKQKSLPAGK